jgi:hypothetical protein
MYKLYSLMRNREDASFAASLMVGFLIVFWIILIVDLFDLRRFLTSKWIVPAFIISIVGNIIFIMRKGNYKKIIDEMSLIKTPLSCQVMVYLLLSWTFIGFALYILF